MPSICRSAFALALALSLPLLVSLAAEAQWRGSSVTCGVYDRGWDENGPDRTCGECLRNHDQCVERCEAVQFSCQASGERLVRSGGAGSGQRLVIGRFSSTSSNRSTAVRQSLEQCRNALLNYSGIKSCVNLGCNQNSTNLRFTCTHEAHHTPAGSARDSVTVETFEAVDSDEFRARDRALDRCYRSGARNCYSGLCSRKSQPYSSRNCDPRERDDHFAPRPPWGHEPEQPVYTPYPPAHGTIEPVPPRGPGRQPRPPQEDNSVRCSSSEYLEQRPDVAAALQPGLPSACAHYQRHGRNEGMCNPCN